VRGLRAPLSVAPAHAPSPPRALGAAAARVMPENRVGAVLVTDAEGHPLGVFTERDLMARA